MSEPLDLSKCRKYKSCKVCSMSTWNVPTFLRLHELALREHYEYAALTKWANTEIEKANAIAPPAEQRAFVTKQQLVTHFTKHVPAEEITRAKMQKATKPMSGVEVYDPLVERKLQELTDRAAAVGVTDLDDFQRYHSTLRRMQARFDKLDDMFLDENFKPEKDWLMAYKGFGDSIARMLKDSIQLRQQERIMQDAIAATLNEMSLGSLASILKSVERAYADIRPLISEQAKSDAVMSSLRDSVGVALSGNAKTALNHLKTVLRVA